MLIDESIVRPSVIFTDGTPQPVIGHIIKSHSPHSTCFITEKDSYAKVLQLMQEYKTERIAFMKEGFTVGYVFKEDIISHLIELIDKRENDLESMAHDFKHPITCIQAINYLLINTPKEQERRTLVDKSDQACRYANSLLNDFILSQKVESYNYSPEHVDMNDIIRDCLPTYKPMIHKKNQFMSIELARQDLLGNIDRIKFHRVIDNLVTNAIKFTPTRGEIKIVSRKISNGIEVKIIDTGIGISADDRNEIFERFSKARRSGTNGEQSTGLGLFITQQIVTAHGGEILIDSEIGKGTTFHIKIPCVK